MNGILTQMTKNKKHDYEKSLISGTYNGILILRGF
jgi:hypothetical protein